jgi:hypothetical protein
MVRCGLEAEMARLEIEKLDENLFKYLELSARLTGRTIEEVAIDLIGKGIKIDGRGRTAISDYSRSLTPPGTKTDSTALIRRMRDGS